MIYKKKDEWFYPEKNVGEIPAREYGEKMDVQLTVGSNGRLCILATNAGGHGITCVDLLDILKWADTDATARFGSTYQSSAARS